MSRPISNEVKVYNIKRPQSNGVVYVYQRTEKYDPETRRMKKAGKDILLGKILPSNPSELVKTRPKKKALPHPQTEAMLFLAKGTKARLYQPKGCM